MSRKPQPFSPSRTARWAVAPLSLALLAACGGGGGGDEPAPAPQPIVKHVLTGQVAVGALVKGAEVFVGCANGGSVANVLSGDNGYFEITLKEGTMLPCVGQARLPSGGVIFSVVPGGNPPVTRVNITPLTSAFTWSLLSSTGNSNTDNPMSVITDTDNTFPKLLDSRTTYNTAQADFANYFTTSTGINVANFDFLTTPLVVGEPADNALEEMRNVEVLSNPNDPNSPRVPLLADDGALSPSGRLNIALDAPIITPADIIPCSAPGNSCGGEAGQTIVITGGSGS